VKDPPSGKSISSRGTGDRSKSKSKSGISGALGTDGKGAALVVVGRGLVVVFIAVVVLFCVVVVGNLVVLVVVLFVVVDLLVVVVGNLIVVLEIIGADVVVGFSVVIWGVLIGEGELVVAAGHGFTVANTGLLVGFIHGCFLLISKVN